MRIQSPGRPWLEPCWRQQLEHPPELLLEHLLELELEQLLHLEHQTRQWTQGSHAFPKA